MAMIGRGCFGNPWLFQQAKAALEGKPIPPLPPLAERCDTAVRQFELAAAAKGERVAVLEARRHYCWYLKGVSHSGYYKEQIVQMNTLEDVYRVTKGDQKGFEMNEQSREQQLVSAARDGDRTPSRRWSVCMRKRVFALTLRMCRNPEDAAEAAQEAFLAAWQGLRILPGRGQLLHLAVPAGVQRLRGLAAAGGPPPGLGRPLPG